MSETIEKRFGVLCAITRAQHFAWREAVAEAIDEADVPALVDRMWEITGEQTGAAYAKRLDLSQPLAPQVAASFVWSSESMGEDAVVEIGEHGEVYVRHDGCPWFDWHSRLGLLAEDRPGCDAWFRSTLARVNRDAGSALAFETLETLPEGGTCCRRRLWEATTKNETEPR